MLVGVVWLLVDAVLIPGMIRQTKQAMRDRVTLEALSQISATALPYDGAGETLPTPSRATLPVPR